MPITRRTFLKGGATSATLSALAPNTRGDFGGGDPRPQGAVHLSRNRIAWSTPNDVSVEFVLEDGKLRGIGSVTAKGKKLRSDAEYIWPQIATPYGAEVVQFEFLDCREEDGALIVATRPCYRIGHRMEWTEQAMHPLVNMGSWSSPLMCPKDARLEWLLRPVKENYGGVEYDGFSYAFRYVGPNYPIYQIEDKASWVACGWWGSR